MIQTGLCYSKEKDVSQVDQFGWIDLRQAFLTHTIPGSASVDDLSFDTDIDNADPRNILGRPRSQFDAYQMIGNLNQQINEQGTSASAD